MLKPEPANGTEQKMAEGLGGDGSVQTRTRILGLLRGPLSLTSGLTNESSR